MNKQTIIKIEEERMAKTYWKRPLIIQDGRGVNLVDSEGNEYIDCTSNYGVAILGHSHPDVLEAIKDQSQRLISCHGTFYNPTRSELLEKLVSLTPKGLDKVFLSNSGAEAVEFALKLARKSTGKKEIIAMMGGFHGKTMGALSATWNRKYRIPFEPLVPGFRHVPFGKIERVEKAVNEETAAIIVEPIQGESGINKPPDDFLPALRELCNDKNILLIADEIQTGLGRTGRIFACDHFGVEPDIICLAKALANGLPIGATISSEEIMSSLSIGDHSSTFGGNPLVCAAAKATLDVIVDENLPKRAEKSGKYLLDKLSLIGDKFKIVRQIRGLGLMIGIELRFDVLNILMETMRRGVLFLDAGRNVIRLLPPLIIKDEELDRVVSVLDETLGEEEAARLRS